MPAFKLNLNCKNCGNDWERNIDEKVEVNEATLGFRGVVLRDRTSPTGKQTTKVRCPVCKLKRDVRIKSREPLK